MGYIKFPWNDTELRIHKATAFQLDSLVYNIEKDWDFVVIITGDRTVRVGKSVLAQTVAAYLAWALRQRKMKTKFDLEDIYFDSKEMINDALQKPKYSINVYDEGREGLAASKRMKSVQQDLLDFFAECGQLNQIFIIVLPDFFGLTEEIAVPRSEYLMNVYRHEEAKEIDMYKDGEKRPIVQLHRGRFEFFSRNKKRILFDKYRTTHRKDYFAVKCNFIGNFVKQDAVNEKEYKSKKLEAIGRFKEKHEKKDKVRNTVANRMVKQFIESKIKEGYTHQKIADEIGCDRQRIGQLIKEMEAFTPPVA